MLNLQIAGSITLLYSKQFAIFYTFTWLYFGLSFELSSGSTLIKFYLNSNLISSTKLQSDHYLDSLLSHFYIGDSVNKMWIYSFIIHSELTSSDVSAEIISSSCMKPSNLNTCLWDSAVGMFYNGSSYLPCDQDCVVCRNSFSCGLCKDPFCDLCDDMETDSCTECFYTFENNGTACVCPLGTMRKKVLCVNCYYQCGYCKEVDPRVLGC